MEPTFCSVFTNRIDAKGRVSVPAPYRALLEGQMFAGKVFSGICAVPSFKYAMIEGSGTIRAKLVYEQLATLPEFSDECDEIQEFFSELTMIPFDGEGRIILTDTMREHANLTDTAVFAGAGNVFQMWEPRAYEAYRETMRARRREKGTVFQPRITVKGAV